MAQPGRHHKVTIADIARDVGVSQATVSRALSNPGRVSFATASAIREAADRLGYRRREVDGPAGEDQRSLIAVLVFDAASSFYFEVLKGMEDEAAQQGDSLLLLDGRGDERLERALLEKVIPVVDGIVLISPLMADRSLLQVAKLRPTVVLNRELRGVPAVVQDADGGMREAVRHLMDLGHGSITYFSGPEASRIEGRRRRALERVCAEQGIVLRRVVGGAGRFREVERTIEQWRERQTSAVICFNDDIALGFCREAARRGIDVPGEVSVIGMGSNPLGTVFQPSLTTISFAARTQGAEAIRVLRSPSPRPPLTVVPSRLIPRESTGRSGQRRSH